MLFKTPRVETEWNDIKLTPLLKSIVEDSEQFSIIAFNKELFLTCIYRTKEEDQALKGSGIHCAIPYRAVDIRSNGWSDSEIESIANRINLNYIYDPQRKGLIVGLYKEHGDGPHLHVQIHNNTILR